MASPLQFVDLHRQLHLRDHGGEQVGDDAVGVHPGRVVLHHEPRIPADVGNQQQTLSLDGAGGVHGQQGQGWLFRRQYRVNRRPGWRGGVLYEAGKLET